MKPGAVTMPRNVAAARGRGLPISPEVFLPPTANSFPARALRWKKVLFWLSEAIWSHLSKRGS